MLTWFCDHSFRYIWKPHYLASTPGRILSIIDLIQNSTYRKENPTIEKLYQDQTQYFTQAQEYGLCNRLDNKTGGLLYFARNPCIYDLYHQAQSTNLVTKTYLADIVGKYRHHSSIIATALISHHPQDSRKMIWWWYDPCTTNHSLIQPMYHDPHINRTTLQIQIKRGKRHQIRIHLASLGYIIVWEDLYISPKFKKHQEMWSFYHLRCVGLQITIPWTS